MEEIKNLMSEQISYMFAHNGERDSDISNRLSEMIDDYCKNDEGMYKVLEVEETWRDFVMTRYNSVINEILNN